MPRSVRNLRSCKKVLTSSFLQPIACVTSVSNKTCSTRKVSSKRKRLCKPDSTCEVVPESEFALLLGPKSKLKDEYKKKKSPVKNENKKKKSVKVSHNRRKLMANKETKIPSKMCSRETRSSFSSSRNIATSKSSSQSDKKKHTKDKNPSRKKTVTANIESNSASETHFPRKQHPAKKRRISLSEELGANILASKSKASEGNLPIKIKNNPVISLRLDQKDEVLGAQSSISPSFKSKNEKDKNLQKVSKKKASVVKPVSITTSSRAENFLLKKSPSSDLKKNKSETSSKTLADSKISSSTVPTKSKKPISKTNGENFRNELESNQIGNLNRNKIEPKKLVSTNLKKQTRKKRENESYARALTNLLKVNLDKSKERQSGAQAHDTKSKKNITDQTCELVIEIKKEPIFTVTEHQCSKPIKSRKRKSTGSQTNKSKRPHIEKEHTPVANRLSEESAFEMVHSVAANSKCVNCPISELPDDAIKITDIPGAIPCPGVSDFKLVETQKEVFPRVVLSMELNALITNDVQSSRSSVDIEANTCRSPPVKCVSVFTSESDNSVALLDDPGSREIGNNCEVFKKSLNDSQSVFSPELSIESKFPQNSNVEEKEIVISQESRRNMWNSDESRALQFSDEFPAKTSQNSVCNNFPQIRNEIALTGVKKAISDIPKLNCMGADTKKPRKRRNPSKKLAVSRKRCQSPIMSSIDGSLEGENKMITENASGCFTAVAECVTECINSVAGDVSSSVSNGAAVSWCARDITADVTDVIRDVADAINIAGDVTDGNRDIADDITDGNEDIAEDVTNDSRNIVEDITDGIRVIVEDVVDGIRDLADGINNSEKELSSAIYEDSNELQHETGTPVDSCETLPSSTCYLLKSKADALSDDSNSLKESLDKQNKSISPYPSFYEIIILDPKDCLPKENNVLEKPLSDEDIQHSFTNLSFAQSLSPKSSDDLLKCVSSEEINPQNIEANQSRIIKCNSCKDSFESELKYNEHLLLQHQRDPTKQATDSPSKNWASALSTRLQKDMSQHKSPVRPTCRKRSIPNAVVAPPQKVRTKNRSKQIGSKNQNAIWNALQFSSDQVMVTTVSCPRCHRRLLLDTAAPGVKNETTCVKNSMVVVPVLLICQQCNKTYNYKMSFPLSMLQDASSYFTNRFFRRFHESSKAPSPFESCRSENGHLISRLEGLLLENDKLNARMAELMPELATSHSSRPQPSFSIPSCSSEMRTTLPSMSDVRALLPPEQPRQFSPDGSTLDFFDRYLGEDHVGVGDEDIPSILNPNLPNQELYMFIRNQLCNQNGPKIHSYSSKSPDLLATQSFVLNPEFTNPIETEKQRDII